LPVGLQHQMGGWLTEMGVVGSSLYKDLWITWATLHQYYYCATTWSI